MSLQLKSLFAAVLLTAVTAVGFDQTKLTVRGKVADPIGAPVAGASVIVVGTLNGTSADGNGNFTLTGVAADAVLSASFMGYTTHEEPVGGRTVVNIILSEDSELLEEIVVVGYGQMKKSDLTGSVASVKTEGITNVPANSIESLMQGRIAGVQITNNSQEPGAASTVRVRGSSSMRGSNAPLLVVDGFPIGEAGNLSEVNPQDIVSMEVLKDVKGIEFIFLDDKDVVRHKLVTDIINAYKRKQETEDGSQETEDGRQETGDGRQETEDRRIQTTNQ